MKKTFIISLGLITFLTLNAREPGSYFHLNVGGGRHDFSYELSDGSKLNAQIGYTANAAYSFFFSKNFGFQTGVGMQTITSLSTLNYTSTIPSVDINGRVFDFRTKYSNWQEKQEAFLLDIPFMLQCRFNIGKTTGLIGSVGGKVGLPVYTCYESTGIGEIVTTGYYSQWNTELSDLPQYGFTTIKNITAGTLSLNPSYMGIADLGGLFKLSDKADLYIGGYVNYGLNNILKSGSKEVYQSDGIYNGLFASNHVTKVKPITFGIKVGIYLNMRKKDSDKDGVVDRKDKCPDTPVEAKGLLDLCGCPLDSDGDSVPDYLDKCMYTPKEAIGFVDQNGCLLDTDGDSIPDYLDKCSNTPKEAFGYIDQKGCVLDTDGDSIPDYLDKCPNTPKEAYGKIDQNGCPLDTDMDGVPDYLDKCPGTPKEAIGQIDQNGCPLDSDDDGVLDYLDTCPRIAGLASNHGCPEVKKEVKALFKQALQGIQFELNKFIIKPVSYNLLNQIALKLMMNPTYYVEIQGHTDNSGKPENNLILSSKRAAAVRSFLINLGIDANRLSSVGYGDTKPVATNTTPRGKAINRRVEFVVSFEAVVKE
jgi:outer membrane protein OmpA-like peptidoglycan-associated protein